MFVTISEHGGPALHFCGWDRMVLTPQRRSLSRSSPAQAPSTSTSAAASGRVPLDEANGVLSVRTAAVPPVHQDELPSEGRGASSVKLSLPQFGLTTSDASKGIDSLLGKTPQRFELRGRQWSAPPQRVGLGTRKSERVTDPGALKQRVVGPSYVGGCRSLTRHDSPPFVSRGRPASRSTPLPSTRRAIGVAPTPDVNRSTMRRHPATQTARPRSSIKARERF